MKRKQTLDMVLVAAFAAIIIIMAFTPFIGYIPLGFTRATIIHIPVIIGSLLLGPKSGAMLGAVFALTSLINNTFYPTATSFVFSPFYTLGETSGGVWSILICFVPRIMIGIVPFYVYKFFHKMLKQKKMGISLALAGVAGSLTNTLLVMGMIWLFFGESYAKAHAEANGTAVQMVYKLILTTICINGVPEAIVAAVIVSMVTLVLMKAKLGRK